MGTTIGTQVLPTFAPGKQLIEGTELNNIIKSIFGGVGVQSTIPPATGSGGFINLGLAGYLSKSVQAGITAYSAGGQTNATPLTADLCSVTTAGAAGASVLLPTSLPGRQITVYNGTANSINIFPAGTDTINGGAASAAIACAAGKTFILSCFSTGAWSSTTAG